MKLRQRLAALRSNTFLRAVGVLVGGTAMAQLITAAVLPLTTRLYSPADFGVLAAFSGAAMIVSSAACLRFEVAIALPDRHADAYALLVLSLLSCAAVCAILGIAVVALPARFVGLTEQHILRPWLWLLPFAVFIAAAYSALQFWFVRFQRFGFVARTRVGQAMAAAGLQVGLGAAGIAPLGLLLGQMLNTGAGSAVLGWRFLRERRGLAGPPDAPQLRRVARQYDRFPKYSALEALCNAAGMQLPVIMIAAMSSAAEAGYLMLAMTAMQAPMGLIGRAVAQVYLSRAPQENRQGNLGPFTVEVFGGLLRSGVGPLILAGAVAPALFAVVFGSDWHRAGVLVAWMTPWFVMQFVSVPVSMGLHVASHQGTALALQVFGLVLRVAAVFLASRFAADAVSEAYALSGFAFYLVYLWAVAYAVGARGSAIAREIRRALPSIGAWAAAGVAALLAMQWLQARIG